MYAVAGGRSLRLTLLLEPTKQRMAGIATSDEPTEKHSSSSIRHQYLPTESPKNGLTKSLKLGLFSCKILKFGQKLLDKSCLDKSF